MAVDGNEIADLWANKAAESAVYGVEKPLLYEASLAYVSRSITVAKSWDTVKLIDSHVKKERRYRPPRGGRIRLQLRGERKALASRYYQFLSGDAAIGKACGWRPPRQCDVCERATKAVLTFLQETIVGCVVITPPQEEVGEEGEVAE